MNFIMNDWPNVSYITSIKKCNLGVTAHCNACGHITAPITCVVKMCVKSACFHWVYICILYALYIPYWLYKLLCCMSCKYECWQFVLLFVFLRNITCTCVCSFHVLSCSCMDSNIFNALIICFWFANPIHPLSIVCRNYIICQDTVPVWLWM